MFSFNQTGTNLPQAAAIRAIRNIGPHVQGGTSININVGADAVRGMSTPTQLVVTQHKTGVGVSQLGPGWQLKNLTCCKMFLVFTCSFYIKLLTMLQNVSCFHLFVLHKTSTCCKMFLVFTCSFYIKLLTCCKMFLVFTPSFFCYAFINACISIEQPLLSNIAVERFCMLLDQDLTHL